MRTLTAVLALVAGTLYGAPEADVKVRIAELEKKAGDVHGVWGSTFCPDYYGYYRLGWDDATRAKNRADYLTYLNELVTLDPSNAVRRMTLGDAYLYQGRFAEARAAYLAGAALPKADDTTKYRCLFGAAECSFALGDRAGTLAELEALAARKLDFRGNPRSPFPDPPLHWAIKYLKGEYLDNIGLPLSNEAKPFPTPQQATYAETFTALDEVTVALDGIGEDDPRLRLVKTRLDRIGAKMRFGGFFDLFRSVPFSLRIEYGADAAEADDAGALSKPEGYVLDIGERGATIRARDARGLTWGVVSFLQSIDYAGRRVRHLKVRDWPVTKNRGFLGRWSFESLEYALFTKLNAVTHMRTPAHWRGWTPLRDWVTLEMGRQFREFGFRLTVSVHWLAMYPQLPISNPRTAAYRADVCRHYAAAGIDVYFPFDDERYADVPKEDRAKWGTEFRQCDADHVNAIYRAVKKDYPDFRMTFCPPFYWGPDSGHPYPEDREKYLDTLKRLDPEIGVYWTGAQVKGISKTKRQVDWYSELIGRKPWIFQNGTGPHNLLEYTVDPINWTGWHYKGFFEDIEGFQRNTDGSGGDDTPDASLADALWNPEQFEPHRAIRRGVDMLCGDGACEALAQGLADVAYFDKYRYSVLTPDILQENPEDLRRKYEHASNVWATATARYPRLKRYAGFTRGLDTARNVSRGAKNPPDFLKRYKDDLARTAKDAAEEAGYDKAKGDVLVTAVDMNGGKLFDDRGNPNTGKIAKRRFCKLIRGAQTTSGRFTFRFECDPFPPTGDFEMVVCARDDELEGANRIRVKANGKTVYEDTPAFPNGDYAVKRFRLPAGALVRHNVIAFENLTDGYSEESGTWFSVNYIVLKKTAGAKINLVVTGSVNTLMNKIFKEKKEPLYGHDTDRMTVRPFEVSVLKEILAFYHPVYAADDLLALWTFTGGVAKYVSLLINRKAYTRRKMIDVLIEEDSYFLDEGWAVLVEEFGKEYGTYFSILSAIARGKTSRAEIMNEIAGDVGGYLTRLEEQFGLIAKHQPLFEPTANKGCRYKLNDNFFRFWFRFVFKHQYLVQVRMFDELRGLVSRDYEVFSCLALEGLFRAEFSERHAYSRMGGWWDRRGENEIDLVCENEFKGTIDFFEVKRDAKRYDRKLLEEKVEAFFVKNPKKRKLMATVGSLSLADV